MEQDLENLFWLRFRKNIIDYQRILYIFKKWTSTGTTVGIMISHKPDHIENIYSHTAMMAQTHSITKSTKGLLMSKIWSN